MTGLAASVDTLERALRQELPELQMERRVLMARYTTLHLGGEADLFCEPATPDMLGHVLRTAHGLGIPVTIIGHGSNLLVRDGGIRGLTVRIAREMRGIEASGDTIRAEAGVMLSTLAMTAAEHSLGGLTFASGIPGTVGGGVTMNAGAYGGEMSDVVIRVEGFTPDGTPFSWSRPELAFGYRTSRVQQEGMIAAAVTCQLPHAERTELLADMVALNRRRAEKQPLTVPSAGSTFKRPKEGYAAAMIEACGLKGTRIGGAEVSEKHAGFLLNRGGTAADFLALMALVQRRVYEREGVLLEPEVRILGEDAPAKEV